MELFLYLVTSISMFLIVYHHAGYPLVLRWLAQHKRHKQLEATQPKSVTRSICMVVPAFNEARYIADKLRNLAALDYPGDKLRVLVACDGCTDDTVAIARQVLAEPECAALRAEVIEFARNRGKVAVINHVAAHVTEDLIAMSDVSALVSMDALQIVAAEFENPSTGVVSGQYRLLSPGSAGEVAYWNYQNAVKSDEATLGATLGVPGAFYVIRRTAFAPLEPDTINDDFVLPMRIVAAGFRAAYSANINAVELEGSTDSMDQRRRRRIAAGNTQQLLRLKALLAPRFGGIAFAFASGKALRVLVPYLMLAALLGSWALASTSALFALLAAGQTCVYAVAALVAWRNLPVPGAIRAVCYLVNGHVAGLLGSLRYLSGLERGRWTRITS